MGTMTSRIISTLGLIIILLASAVGLTDAGQRNKGRVSDDDAYAKEIAKWRAERVEEVSGENGWLGLVGLFWLHDGENKLGSDSTNDIVLPPDRAPRFAGSLWLNKEVVRLEAKPESGLTNEGLPAGSLVLHSDADGKPTQLKIGSLTLFVIKRGDKLGLRVRDKRHPARSHFSGLDYFPIDVKWKLKVKFEPHVPPKVIPIVNVLGMVDSMPSPGALVFEVYAKSYRLETVTEKGSKQLFIIFADRTTGKETYGAGRYLYAEPPGTDGQVILDFNKAYNPPCAFTKFATCPLPPRQNRLALRVDAGEKKYAGAEH
jgi:uncharacterized protein (DUF1684 family)